MDGVTKEKLIDDLRVVASDVEELLRATAHQGGERIAEARARAEESLRAAQARLQEAGVDMMDYTRDAAQSADRYVRDNPWQSIGIGAGVGLLIGYLIGRR
jgi:ElaB/YqjD/DUF883 family membrane-anchored ribosome-binding protein